MSSKETLDVDFERDLPTTAADLEALARERELRPLTTIDYLQWLTELSVVSRFEPRLNTPSDEPFEL